MTAFRPADWFPLHLSTSGDHHADLADLRAEDPVHPVTVAGTASAWVVTGYDDVSGVLADDRSYSLDIVEQRYGAVLGGSLVTLSPAARRALRRVLLDELNPERPHVAAVVEDVVAAQVAGLRDRLRTGEPVDLVPSLAAEVPARVLARLLGLHEDEWQQLVGLSAAASRLIDEPRAALRAGRGLRRRLTQLLDEQDRRSGDVPPLLRALAGTRVGGTRLTQAEMVASLLLLGWAGTETAFPAIATNVYALLAHPGEAAVAAGSRSAALAAADETLRWEAPVQVTSRRVVGDVELAGRVLPADSVVLAHLGAANRDPHRFLEPDAFQPGRTDPTPHLAFGHGPHRCPGWQLARSEMSVATQLLLAELPDLRLVTGSPGPEGQVVRSPRRLLVESP